MSDTPTVVIVDDHRIFRSGVRAELGEAVEVVGEAEPSRTPSARSRGSSPTSSCSMSICPAVAESR